jgi:hypothetical protein
VRTRIIVAASVAAVLCVAAQTGAARIAAHAQAPATARPAPLPPNPSTQAPAHRLTYEQVIQMEKSLSNWGRWGKDDERGTFNLPTGD